MGLNPGSLPSLFYVPSRIMTAQQARFTALPASHARVKSLFVSKHEIRNTKPFQNSNDPMF
jgi:hypothetical protein